MINIGETGRSVEHRRGEHDSEVSSTIYARHFMETKPNLLMQWKKFEIIKVENRLREKS